MKTGEIKQRNTKGQIKRKGKEGRRMEKGTSQNGNGNKDEAYERVTGEAEVASTPSAFSQSLLPPASCNLLSLRGHLNLLLLLLSTSTLATFYITVL